MRISALIGACLLLAAEGAAYAQDVADADTLPAHAGGIIIKPAMMYGQGGERYGPGWHLFGGRESFLTDFDNINLGKILAGDKADTLRNLFGDLGTTRFRAPQTGYGINLVAAYGITDRLTVAALLPWQYFQYHFDAWLVPSTPGPGQMPVDPAHYMVGDPKSVKCPMGNFKLDQPDDLFKILQHQDGYNFNIRDLRNALTSDCLDYLDPLDTLYQDSDRIIHGTADRTFSGFRDLILGAKYKFFHGRSLQLAGMAYVIAPTGKVEDPRDLFHLRLGDGTWNAALLLGATVPLGKFRVFGSFAYEYVFPDQHQRRVSGLSFSDALENQLATGQITQKELFDKHLDEGSYIPLVTKYDTALVTRKLGDNLYLYSGAGYDILEWLSVGVRLDSWYHFRDQIQTIGPRFDNTPAYKSEAEIHVELEQKITAGTIFEDSACIADPSKPKADCRTGYLAAALRDSLERKKAAYGWHTVRGQVIGSLSLNVNMLGPWSRGEFPIPLIAGIWISRFLAGENIDIQESFGISLVLPIPFGEIKDPAEYGFDDEPEGGLPWP